MSKGFVRARLAMIASVSILLSTLVAVAPANAALATDALSLPDLLITQAENTEHSYDRSHFKHWIDADRNGCNTRYEVLIVESVSPVTVGPKCELFGGKWVSPYDNVTRTAYRTLDVDHMVPLSEAWRSGAWSWTAQERQQFANDLDVEYALIAVTDAANRSKGDRDPARWVPSYEPYKCEYVTNWALVKYRWSLTVDPAEMRKLKSVLSGSCGSTSVTLPSVEISTTSGPPVNGVTTKSDPSFSDVPTSHQYYKEISWLASTGITKGYSDGTFKWSKSVSRQAMAAFLYRFAGSPSYNPPNRSKFKDVKTSHQYYKEISWLESTGITKGYSDGTFKWSKPVSRQAMAAFLYRFNETFGVPTLSTPASPGDSVNCSDFTTWRAAQNWYEKHYPYFGDIGRLDGDKDGYACQGLPGAP